jgi:hypothetical protein
MTDNQRQADSGVERSGLPSRRAVLGTTLSLGLGTLASVGRSRARSDHRVEYGETVTGTTDTKWVFEAAAGDEVSIEVRPDDPVSHSTDIELFDPDEDLVERVGSTGEDGNAALTLYDVERGQDGDYTVLVSGDGSFDYELSLYEGVPVDQPIEYGETVESELTRENRYYRYAQFKGYHETYGFEASDGDEVSIEVRPDDPVEENADITLFDPDGEMVERVGSTGEDGNAVIARYDVERGQGGQYTIVATGEDPVDLFGYEISLYEGVPIDQPIEYGATVESELTRENRYYRYAQFKGYHETYGFEASDGDEVSIEVRPDDPVEENADITLFDPDGEMVERVGSTGEDGNAVIARYDVERGQGGQYTIVATGEDPVDLFGYELWLYEGVPVDQPIEYGATVESELTRENRYDPSAKFTGYHETYGFEASDGDEVSIGARPVDPVDEAAQITLLDPAGETVEDVGPTGEEGDAVISEYEFESGQGGQHTIVVSGVDHVDLFEYTLEVVLENRDAQTTTTAEPTTTEATTAEPDLGTDAPTSASTTPASTSRETVSTTDETDAESIGPSPGYGVASGLTALGGAGYLLKRRLGREPDEE